MPEGSREEAWMDGWAGTLSSNSVIFPGWESGLQLGEESTGAEGERELGGHGRLCKPGRLLQ